MLEVAWTLWIEIDKLWMFKHTYHSTLAGSTQIVLFIKMLNFFFKNKIKEKLCGKENKLFKYSNMFNMKYSKLINYLTNLCRSWPCTRICKIVSDLEREIHCYGSHFSLYMSNFGVIVFSIFCEGIRTRLLCVPWSENMFISCLSEWQYHSMDPLLFSGKTFTNLWPTNRISIYSKCFLMKKFG
jgi:hypothetical protein